MSVTPTKLMLPKGQLDPAQFLPRVLATDLQAWIDEGVSLTTGLAADTQDQAVTAWAYYRARKYQVERMSGDPAKMTVDSGRSSREYTNQQIDEFRIDRDYWFDQYSQLTTKQSSSVAVGKMNNSCAVGSASWCSRHRMPISSCGCW